LADHVVLELRESVVQADLELAAVLNAADRDLAGAVVDVLPDSEGRVRAALLDHGDPAALAFDGRKRTIDSNLTSTFTDVLPLALFGVGRALLRDRDPVLLSRNGG